MRNIDRVIMVHPSYMNASYMDTFAKGVCSYFLHPVEQRKEACKLACVEWSMVVDAFRSLAIAFSSPRELLLRTICEIVMTTTALAATCALGVLLGAKSANDNVHKWMGLKEVKQTKAFNPWDGLYRDLAYSPEKVPKERFKRVANFHKLFGAIYHIFSDNTSGQQKFKVQIYEKHIADSHSDRSLSEDDLSLKKNILKQIVSLVGKDCWSFGQLDILQWNTYQQKKKDFSLRFGSDTQGQQIQAHVWALLESGYPPPRYQEGKKPTAEEVEMARLFLDRPSSDPETISSKDLQGMLIDAARADSSRDKYVYRVIWDACAVYEIHRHQSLPVWLFPFSPYEKQPRMCQSFP